MKHILFTWELGAGYGHIAHLLPIAEEMQKRGFSPIFAIKDLARAENALGKYNFPILQAPAWMAKPVGMPPAVTFSDILFRSGYFSVDGLTSLLKAWHYIFSLVKPSLIVADHSPTALLAARGTSIPKIVVGSSFTIPPLTTPLPPLMKEGISPKELNFRETTAIENINQALAKLEKPPIDHLCDIFKVNGTFMFTIPEFDHYGHIRKHGSYIGPAIMQNCGLDPIWPQYNGKKIFAYLYPSYKGFKHIIKVLNRLNCASIIYAPGISKREKTLLQTDKIFIYEDIINLNNVIKVCDAAICHSGAGTGSAFLLAGIPVLLLPFHLEQMTIAKLITRTGAGLMLMPDAKKLDYKKAIKNLLDEPHLAQNAKLLSQKYQYCHIQGVKKIAKTCDTLLSQNRNVKDN